MSDSIPETSSEARNSFALASVSSQFQSAFPFPVDTVIATGERCNVISAAAAAEEELCDAELALLDDVSAEELELAVEELLPAAGVALSRDVPAGTGVPCASCTVICNDC